MTSVPADQLGSGPEESPQTNRTLKFVAQTSIYATLVLVNLHDPIVIHHELKNINGHPCRFSLLHGCKSAGIIST